MQIGSFERDPIRLADWAELKVLYSTATSISWESIRTEVNLEGFLDADDLFDEDYLDEPALAEAAPESLLADTIREIHRRMASGGRGYPFRIQKDKLELRPGVHRRTPYAFCLMVSDRDYYTASDPAPRMFEHIASVALKSYLQGSSYRFGAPRSAPDQQIKTALIRLEEQTGDKFKNFYPIRSTDKDLGLDVVGWKDFVDSEISKLLVYMQCATGEDWPKKSGDLDLGTAGVWNKTMEWTVPPVKAMAIPYVVPPGIEWERATPGVLFLDRLRITSLLPARSVSQAVIAEGVDWNLWFEERKTVVANSIGP